MTVDEIERLRTRLAWLRRAYGELHRSRRRTYRLVDDNYSLLQEAVEEKVRLEGQREIIDHALHAAVIERDGLQDEATGWRAENDRHRALYVEAVRERDDLRTEIHATRDTIGHILLALIPTNAPPGIVEFAGDSVVDIVKSLVADRDRLRAGIMTAEVHGEMIVRMRESVWLSTVADRDRFLEALMATYAMLERPEPAPNGDYTIVPLLVAGIMGERNRWQTHTERVAAERDRLQDRVKWLRRAYGKAWLRRRSMSGLIRDVDNARRSAKAERDRLQAALWEGQKYRAGLAGRIYRLEEERDRLQAVVDAVQEHRVIVARLTGGDHEPEEEIGLDEAQWANWRRITEMIDQLDGSPATESNVIGDDEPEVQHVPECEHPTAPCTCPRDHLLSEAQRIREMCLSAEAEFARENRRAVDLKIERGRLRVAVTDWLDAVVRADGTAQSALDRLGAMVGWQLEVREGATDG